MENDKLSSTIIGKAQLRGVTVRSILFFGLIGFLAVIFHFLLRPSPLTLFILFFLGERIYESYFKVQRCADGQLSQDRHLNQIIMAFSVMVFSAVLEFYFKHQAIVPFWTFIGFFLLGVSGYLRWSAIKTVGNDWAIDTFAIPAMIQRLLIDNRWLSHGRARPGVFRRRGRA